MVLPIRSALHAAAVGLLALPALVFTPQARAGLLTNGDFETPVLGPGVVPGWTFGPYQGGQGVAESAVLFDTSGLGASLAARFNVGNGNPGGLQLIQSFSLAAAGFMDFGVDVATVMIGVLGEGGGNADGGTYVLAIDGMALDTFTVGSIPNGTTVRRHLAGGLALGAGTHTFEIDMARFFNYQNSGLWLYVDNAGALEPQTGGTVAEPPVWALLGLGGLAGVAARLRRRRQPATSG
jgi:hypothetical protein